MQSQKQIATNCLIEELKKTTPSKEIIIEHIKNASVATKIEVNEVKTSIAHCILSKFKGKDLEEIQNAAKLPEGTYVDWVKINLLLALSQGYRGDSYIAKLQSTEFLSTITGIHKAWMHYEKDGLIIFFTQEEKKLFDSVIKKGLDRIKDFKCEDIVEKIRTLPLPPDTTLNTSFFSFWNKTRTLTSEELKEFNRQRFKIIDRFFECLSYPGYSKRERFLSELEKELKDILDGLPKTLIYKDLQLELAEIVKSVGSKYTKSPFEMAVG